MKVVGHNDDYQGGEGVPLFEPLLKGDLPPLDIVDESGYLR